MSIADRIKEVRQRVFEASARYHRDPNTITILAVSKTQSIEKIREAIHSNLRELAESYVQEAIEKMTATKEENLIWHFIGSIQSNKTKEVAQYFQWVHGIDREKIAERLNAQRSPGLPSLNVCIQVNIDHEDTKSGVTPTNVIALAQKIVSLPNLKLRGLMAIPRFYSDFQEQRAVFRRVKGLFDQLNQLGFELDTLSMGMSHDYEAAIAEGSTIVRIGTAIFGERS